MTDQTQTPAGQDTDTQAGDASGPSARRRALVRAASAVPVILTLHSGAALARSSNLISTVQNLNPDGSANCLDTNGLESPTTNVYDLGEPPSATVYRLDPAEVYKKQAGGGRVQDLNNLCVSGEPFYNQDDTQTVYTIQGGLVSATALSSFAGRITVKEI